MGKIDMLGAQLYQQLALIDELNEKAIEQAWQRWDAIAKPLRSLGLLEQAVVKIAGMQKTANVQLDKKAIVVMCADHGVVAEGVTQTGSDVTRIVAENLTAGKTSVNVMAARAGADVFPVDMGMIGEAYPTGQLQKNVIFNRKLGNGTGNIAIEPAMTREQCIRGILAGIEVVASLVADGYQIIGTGEMGIGNTTPSSALVSVLLNLPSNEVTGKGAGLSDVGLKKKIQVIEQSVARYWKATETSEIEDNQYFKVEAGIELLSHLGGFEIVGMTGLFLGGAIYGVPIVIDGFISATAALCANLIHGNCMSWMLASHVSAEPAGRKILRHMHLYPVIDAGMCLGEGTGAAAAMALFDMGLDVYHQMHTFKEAQIKPYEHMEKDI